MRRRPESRARGAPAASPGEGAPRAPRRRLESDGARYWTSTAAALLVTVVGAVVATVGRGVSPEPTVEGLAVFYFAMWILFCWFYAALTWRVMRTLDGSRLADSLREDVQARRARRRSESLYGTGGPSAAVVLCVAALAAVLCTALLPELRANTLTTVLAILVVAATWVLLVTVYAVHYAREQANTGGLQFLGREDTEVSFDDFAYLSVQVATTFATSDVTVTSTAMRREVTVHSVIAFTFNTVVVALLVSLLLTGGT
ncbi:DUF1345 domain-containing protein [Phycicoccus avicenniae]|uniref:DUF1345 domain-containing protein n=1 Tax=Phycicoccus avicenniae TaxID=2828860 RepID=UPI003D2B6D2B